MDIFTTMSVRTDKNAWLLSRTVADIRDYV